MGIKRNFVACSTGGRLQLKVFLEQNRLKQELIKRQENRRIFCKTSKRKELAPIAEEPQNQNIFLRKEMK